MLTNTPCVHLIKNAYFAGIHSFAIQFNEYKQLQDTTAMNNLNPSLSAPCRDAKFCVSTFSKSFLALIIGDLSLINSVLHSFVLQIIRILEGLHGANPVAVLVVFVAACPPRFEL